MFDRSSMLPVRKLPLGTSTVDPSGCLALHVSMAVWIARVHNVELSPTAPCSVIEQTGPVTAGLSPVLAIPVVGLLDATPVPAIAPVAMVTAAMKTQTEVLGNTLFVATTCTAAAFSGIFRAIFVPS